MLIWTWRFGNAILSRHPISDAELIRLPAYAQWESWLGGQKDSVRCDIKFAGQPIEIIAAHLSPRSESVRVHSVDQLIESSSSTSATIIAGDFNSAPKDFPFCSRDADGRNAIDTMSGLFQRLPSVLPDEEGFTFRSHQPDRVIDWIFASNDWSVKQFEVDPARFSDHRMIHAELELPTDQLAQ